MEFRLDDAQVELQATVSRFCEDRFAFDSIAARELLPLDRDAWNELASLGVLALLVDEDHGGSGLGPVEGALVLEQLGSHLVPGPILWSTLAASLVPEAGTGELVVGGVDGADVERGVAIVEHGAEVDAVAVFEHDRVVLHHRDALAEPVVLDPLDPLTPVARLTGLSGGEVVGDAVAARRLRALGTVLAAAELSGLAARSLEVARSYALERQQFDVPIGSFQAVQHLLADMYVRAGLAQCATYAAAAVLDDPDDDHGAAVASAKFVAADAAIANASSAVQVLGGMGFTWDMLPNHLLKRAWVREHTFGAGEHHAERLGAALVGASR